MVPNAYLPHDTYHNILGHHYLWICICEFTYLLKLISNTKINIHGAFTVIHGHTQRGKKFKSPDKHVPKLRFNKGLCLLVQAPIL